MNDQYQGLAKTACAVPELMPTETLEDSLNYQRRIVAKRLAAIDEALTQLHNHPEVQDVLEALKKVQSY